MSSVVFEEERRIYVVVADTVVVPVNPELTAKLRLQHDLSSIGISNLNVPTRIVKQPLGRQFAQGVHAAGAMRSTLGAKAVGKQFHEYSADKRKNKPVFTWSYKDVYQRFTTIVLSARDMAEMYHVKNLLLKASIPSCDFWDSDNEEAYGKYVTVFTAFCTDPIEPSRLVGILDYLPLWGTPDHLALHTRPVS